MPVKRHATIDLETTSTNPNQGRILTIGVAAGNISDPNDEPLVLDLVVSPDDIYNRVDQDDQDTIDWWVKQDSHAYEMAFCRPGDHIENVLSQLGEWLKENDVEYVWGNGPSFDMSFLERYYNELGMKVPYSFRNVRDVRTIMHLGASFGVFLKDIPSQGQQHVAVVDALFEYKAIQAAWLAIKEGSKK